MLKDFSWNMTGYIPKHSVEPSTNGISQYVAERMGLLSFILQIFVFQKPNGTLGFAICVISALMILVSILKLCILSPKFQNSFLAALDVFTWLP